MKQKPCTIGAKHSWHFVRNVTLKSARISSTGTFVKYSFRGLYKCACGESRHGRQHDEVKP